MATDINPKAVDAALRTAAQNNIVVEVHQTSFVESVYGDVAGNVDVLLFNPPYVVTPPEEVGSDGIEASWAGGLYGEQTNTLAVPCPTTTSVLYWTILSVCWTQSVQPSRQATSPTWCAG